MFIGYQLKKVGEELKTVKGEDGALTSVVVDITEPFISYIAETREELESMPCITFDRIEETDVDYIRHNEEYKTKEEVEEIERLAKLADAQRYLDETDWYVTRWMEKGKAIPEEISIAREEARQEIELLRGDK